MKKSVNLSLRAIISLSWQSVAYGIGTLGSQFIMYIMLPFLTRYMLREEYGVISVMVALFAFLNMLTNAGLPSATFRFYNDSKDETDQRYTLGASQFLFFFFSFVPAIGILFFATPLSLFLLGSARYALALQVMAGYLVVSSMNTFGTIILRIEVRALTSSVHSILLIACKTGLALLFVIVYQMGVLGYWVGYLIGEFLGFAFMAWLVRKNIIFQISWGKILELTRFGVPLIPATLSMTVLRLADRYVINALAGLEQVAIYDVGYKVGAIIVLLIAPFRTAWVPFAFSIARKPEAPKTYRDVLTYFSAACLFLILGVFAFRGLLIRFTAPSSYAGAEIIVGWVAAAQLFLAIYHVLSIGPLIKNRTRDLALVAVLAGSLNLLLNYLLIPRIGILGSAIATFVGYFALAVLTYYIGKRLFTLPVDWLRLSRLFLAAGLVAFGISIVEKLVILDWVKFVFKISALLLFPALLLLIGFVSKRQIEDVLNIGKELLMKKIERSAG